MRFLKILCFITFSINVWAQGPVTLNFDADVPEAIQAQFRDDLRWLYSLTSSNTSPLHQQIYGNSFGESYQRFFESYVKKVGFHDCFGGISVACVIGGEEPGKIFITPEFANRSTTRLMRLMTLFHEARHLDTDVANWPHDLCPVPFLDENGQDIVGVLNGDKLEGQDACDWSVYGAYGTTAVMMSNIARFCTNCTDSERALAQDYAKMLTYRVTDPESRKKLIIDSQ